LEIIVSKSKRFSGLKQFSDTVPQNFAEREKGDHRDKVAKKLGFSGWHYEKARERQGTRTDLNIQQNFAECEKGQHRDKVAKKLGFSGWHYASTW